MVYNIGYIVGDSWSREVFTVETGYSLAVTPGHGGLAGIYLVIRMTPYTGMN